MSGLGFRGLLIGWESGPRVEGLGGPLMKLGESGIMEEGWDRRNNTEAVLE